MRLRRLLFAAVLALLCAGALYASFQASRASAAAPLSSYAPPGALLAIESPDFASVLRQWTGSPEQKRWLGSENYAGFSRSRLFGRLAEAQTQFATTVGLAPDTAFLEAIAGKESLFAWYDIGKLEFLYITRMPEGGLEKTPLFELRSRFQERKVGDTTFYMRTDQDTNRTVAFAARGDLLLLATSADLMASALDLMQKPTDRRLGSEQWYAVAVAAAARTPGDLRMTMNLDRIVPSPYFRSYWIQQNITELKQYTAAISDLYREKSEFREERTLLPVKVEDLPAPAELSAILAYVPVDTGVYRAVAGPSVDEALGQLDDRLLVRAANAYRDPRIAPLADISVPTAGSTSDLEQFIDEPFIAADPRAVASQSLKAAITRAQLKAMLVYSSAAGAQAETADPIFTSIHAAVVLQAAEPWSEADLQRALTTALGPTISVAAQGLSWTAQRDPAGDWSELDGVYGLALAVRGTICVIATDRATLRQSLLAVKSGDRSSQVATVVGGFSHAAEREPFLHIAGLVDHSGAPVASVEGNPPPFLSGNVGSLSNTFRDLASENFVETSAAGTTSQTVVYRWR